ncbi:hypothetical protein F4781DRAFT_395065 [Annulohypoxylon bovei var. microspora]|nr:hypothetical protein F4781DRAFT_395065 [Annulohypoxylon bovei var. microspora]
MSEFIVHEVKPTSIIVLLTSCQGKWPDTGWGAELKRSYPAAYDQYKVICGRHVDQNGLPTDYVLGTCHIIPPLPADYLDRPVPPVYIACVFCSFGDGHRNLFNTAKPGRSPKAVIRAQTDNAFCHLKQLVTEMGRSRAQEASRLAGAEMVDGRLQRLDWTEAGRNMEMCVHDQNGKDFQMEWEEIQPIIQTYFHDWEGRLRVFTVRSEHRSGHRGGHSSGNRSGRH